MDIARAIYFCQTQECLLHKCHGTLERMQALAAISRNSSDLYREGYASDFYTVVSEVARIAAKENDGNRLFDGATQIVDIDREGSKLVMAGVNLDKKVFRNVLAANIQQCLCRICAR